MPNSEIKIQYNREYMRKKRSDGVGSACSDYYKLTRNKIIELLGRRCVRCSFDDIRALQIDHIAGGGRQDRIKSGKKYYFLVLGSVVEKENKYQLLCANCNWIKRAENGEHK